ncbi:exopolysaccharide biosynthesis protein [Henriciella mobilis]|uniref:Exopolysaccharide biosynthesis protein n=1 Tax=Henriciella mobilis TaxID=2305467 RepID=A0A399RMY2_9PROT|nr:exopolysaccharide biosynthesis protein [Henriciella mobilis]RIJ33130.1 exopolysaccharide biosynthesis protein [Henriciella mobilis]
MTASRDDPLENVLDRAINDIDGEKITFGDVLDLFGDRSFGPVIAFLGLLVVLPPLGAVPGLPALIGLIIIMFSLQILFGAKHIWVPKFVQKRSIGKDKLKAANCRAKPWLKRIDKLISERLEFLTGRIAVVVAALMVTLLALLMIPLELVPFAVAAPGAAIVLFGLAFVARDGVLMLLGYVASIAATVITIITVPWGSLPGL